MSMHPILVCAALGYVLGSVPFGYMLVWAFRGSDVRATGSGNIGATNVARTSPALGLVTLLLDALKGMSAVALALTLYPHLRIAAFVAAFAAICGHVFPVWLGFRGGKGVATGLGSFALLMPKAILIAVGIFIAVAALLRWVALASIAATAAVPVLARVLGETSRTAHASWPDLAGILVKPETWVCAGSVLIIVKHRSNIRRMLSGTEPHFHLKRP